MLFKAHYKVTHLGNDLHANAATEYPAVYANRDYKQVIYYGGAAPWTNQAVTVTTFADLPQFSGPFYDSEHWAALVDAQNMALPSTYLLLISI